MDKNKSFLACNSYFKRSANTTSQSFWNKISKTFDKNILGPIILENSFIKIAKLFKIEVKRYFILFKNHLVYMSKKTHKYEKIVNLDDVLFDTKIQNNKRFFLILKKPDIEIVIMTSDKKQFKIWEVQLSKICFRTNFENHYKILQFLGSGNYSKVYLAKKILDDTKFAVKVFDKTLLNSDIKVYQLMMNEIKLTRTFSHPFLVQVYETYKVNGSFSMVMEYMSGGELLGSINKFGKISEVNCAIIMKNLLEGLQYLHSRSILHRDLKPENILLQSKNNYSTLKIADFGFATYIEEISSIYPRCGTPGYVAPEFLNITIEPLNAHINHKADLFSSGCIMYKVLTGSSLFQSSKIKDVLKINKECKINFDSSNFKQMSSSALSLLKRILIKDPKNRIDTIEILNHEYFNQDSFAMDIPTEDISVMNNQLVYKFNMEQLKERNLTRANSVIYSKLMNSKLMSAESFDLPSGCFNLSKPFIRNKNLRDSQSLMDDNSFGPRSRIISDKIDFSGKFSLQKKNNSITPILSPLNWRSSSRFNTIVDPLSPISTPKLVKSIRFNDYIERNDRKSKTYFSSYLDKEADKEADKDGNDGNDAKSLKIRRQSTYNNTTINLNVNAIEKSNRLIKTMICDPRILENLKIVIEGNEQA